MIRRIAAIALKEWRFFERGTLLYAVLVLPAILSFLWGYCAAVDLEDVGVAVLDGSRSRESRDLVRGLERSGAFRVVERVESTAGLERALVRGSADLGLAIPASYAKDLARGREARVLLVADGADASLAGEGVRYATRTIAAAGRGAGDPGPRVETRVRAWYARSLAGRDFLLLNAVVYYLVTFIYSPSSSLLADRREGALGVLRGSPTRAFELWLGILLPHGAVALWGALTQVGLVLLVGGVPFRGGAGLFFAALALLAIIHMNLGCTIPALVSRVEQRTVIVTMFTLVAIVFSGYLLPLEFLPAGARWVAEAIPMTHGLALIRGIFLKGAGPDALAHSLAALAIMVGVTSVIAIVCLRALLREEGEH
jgi:ABC-2 type transport system permease protein